MSGWWMFLIAAVALLTAPSVRERSLGWAAFGAWALVVAAVCFAALVDTRGWP